MNENTKIITNLAIAIMKKQKRERPVREKDQRNSQSPSPSRWTWSGGGGAVDGGFWGGAVWDSGYWCYFGMGFWVLMKRHRCTSLFWLLCFDFRPKRQRSVGHGLVEFNVMKNGVVLGWLQKLESKTSMSLKGHVWVPWWRAPFANGK